jgi:hypothetical protein
VPVEGRTEPVPRIIDEGLTDKSAHDLLGLNLERGEKGKKAYEIIVTELSAGPKTREQLNAATSQGAGASAETTWRALNKLKGEGVVSCKKVGTVWTWTHKDTTAATDDDIPF